MDPRKLFFIFACIIFVAGVIFLSCSSKNEPPVIYPETNQITVHYISPSQAPAIDGTLDAIWETADLTQLTSIKKSDFNPSGKLALLNIYALCDSTNLYLLASWRDSTRNVRYLEWLWDSITAIGPWRHSVASKEDNFAIFFAPDTISGSSLQRTAARENCSQMCHEEQLVMVNEGDRAIDGWYWRAGLTNPLSLALDLYIQDSLECDLRFLGCDAGTKPAYITNEIDSLPKYIYKDSLRYRGDYLFAADTTRFQSINIEIDTIIVPAFVLFTDAAGSRWDIQAVGQYHNDTKRWIVEFKRAMNTGNSDDFVFTIDKEVEVYIAIGNNAKNPHLGFDPVILKF